MNILIQEVGVILALSVLTGCAANTPSKPESATAPGADIAAYSSFGWQSVRGANSSNPPRGARSKHAAHEQ